MVSVRHARCRALPCAAGRLGASRSSRYAAAAYAASITATRVKGDDRPRESFSANVVNAEIAVPPMPTPKMPSAVPRRAGGNHALTSGTPTANVVPPSPSSVPPTSMSV
jgi:hypothetical protein